MQVLRVSKGNWDQCNYGVKLGIIKLLGSIGGGITGKASSLFPECTQNLSFLRFLTEKAASLFRPHI